MSKTTESKPLADAFANKGVMRGLQNKLSSPNSAEVARRNLNDLKQASGSFKKAANAGKTNLEVKRENT